MNHKNSSYQQVLQPLFGARFSATSIFHQKNKDFNNSIYKYEKTVVEYHLCVSVLFQTKIEKK